MKELLIGLGVFVVGVALCVALLQDDLPAFLQSLNLNRLYHKTVPKMRDVNAGHHRPFKNEDVNVKTTTAAKEIRVLQLSVDPQRGGGKVLASHTMYLPGEEWSYSAIVPPKGVAAHTLLGALGGSAVCEGIALYFKLLCDVVGIPCRVVLGHLDTGSANSKKETVNHAWNAVCLDEREVLLVDVTQDLRTNAFVGSSGEHIAPPGFACLEKIQSSGRSL